MQVIGLCRFSYLGTGGFQITHDDLKTRAQYLFEKQRMDLRFRFFENICLPGIRAQTDPDFTLVVVVSEEMPAVYMERLQAAVADIPQIVIEARPPGRHRAVMHTVIEDQHQDRSAPCLQFRLDDDDGMSVHFVEQLRALASKMLPMLDRYKMMAIDFNRGYVIAPTETDLMVAPVQQPFWANALALLKRGNARLSIHSFAHRKLWQHVPALSLPDAEMMLRGLHYNNDSRRVLAGQDFGLAPITDAQAERLELVYNIDVKALRAAFAAPE
jgi:hypothetical protein